MIEPPALMPAYRAAVRLRPADRSSKPLDVLNRNQETSAATSSATTKPQWTRRLRNGISCGTRTKSITFEIGCELFDWRRKSVRSDSWTIWSAT